MPNIKYYSNVGTNSEPKIERKKEIVNTYTEFTATVKYLRELYQNDIYFRFTEFETTKREVMEKDPKYGMSLM